MKKLIILGLCLFLSGCFELKTPLPQVSYFDLDENFKEKKCKKSINLGISEIRSVAVYENPSMILRKANGEIVASQTQVWIDLPKNLFKKMLLKKFNAECIHTSIPPFSGIKNDFLLKMEILNFDILASGEVEISVFYELSSLKNFEVLKSGIISQKEKGTNVESFKKSLLAVLSNLVSKIRNNS
ncbi:hypothetical protein CQA62_00850 [Helicobacter cholecystus]|uniref:Uncharacterized protein n=1 Tax=Helicobacter cholecystus TaxID=45498 RepID=A0A3D8IXK3_9HELI|nr:ABC-type transport auxiliary lipoprotein family protein [Helicobacter cholecystus]RDU69992.1 hypothetical protein CQA62_00850 [Helicobacter cholecystus]VEJ24838.1 outer membrane protein [Helicobacter cholecystus]